MRPKRTTNSRSWSRAMQKNARSSRRTSWDTSILRKWTSGAVRIHKIAVDISAWYAVCLAPPTATESSQCIAQAHRRLPCSKVRYLTKRLELKALNACLDKRQALLTLMPLKRGRGQSALSDASTTPSPSKDLARSILNSNESSAVVRIWHEVRGETDNYLIANVRARTDNNPPPSSGHFRELTPGSPWIQPRRSSRCLQVGSHRSIHPRT